jgi:hypothetical protein
MRPTALQDVRLVLDELELDTHYQAFAVLPPETFADSRFNAFRQEVDLLGIRCLQLAPNEASQDEVRQRLHDLRDACMAKLTPFRPFIEKALAELDR